MSGKTISVNESSSAGQTSLVGVTSDGGIILVMFYDHTTASLFTDPSAIAGKTAYLVLIGKY